MPKEQDPRIPIKREVKEKLEKLFVGKFTYNQIVVTLIEFYEKNKKNGKRK